MARNTVAKKVYVDAAGEESRSASVDADRLEFRFASGEVRSIRVQEMGEDIRVCAAWHGMAQKLGDSYASAKTESEAIEAFDETLESLMEGQWVTAREGGGPRISQLALAYAAAKRESGVEMTDEQALGVVKGWNDETRKSAAVVPQIAAHLARLRLEAAQKRAEEKAKEAAEAGVDALAAL